MPNVCKEEIQVIKLSSVDNKKRFADAKFRLRFSPTRLKQAIEVFFFFSEGSELRTVVLSCLPKQTVLPCLKRGKNKSRLSLLIGNLIHCTTIY